MSTPRWFTHANVNTADVAAAERFYTEVIGLAPVIRTAPVAAQDGSGFGLGGVGVRWEGVLLGDHRAGRGPQVDLLEWKQPPTAGRSATEPSHLGHSALRFGLADVDAAVDRIAQRGGRSERWRMEEPGGEQDLVVTAGPDGTRIELVFATEAPVYAGVRVNCSDLARSASFYEEAVGLTGDPPRTVSVSGADGSPVGRFRARRMYLAAQPERFFLELTQWEQPATVGTPAAPGNHAGIYRVALTVDDMEASLGRVRTVTPDAPPALDVDVGEEFPLVHACFFPDPDGAIVEFIQRFRPVAPPSGA